MASRPARRVTLSVEALEDRFCPSAGPGGFDYEPNDDGRVAAYRDSRDDSHDDDHSGEVRYVVLYRGDGYVIYYRIDSSGSGSQPGVPPIVAGNGASGGNGSSGNGSAGATTNRGANARANVPESAAGEALDRVMAAVSELGRGRVHATSTTHATQQSTTAAAASPASLTRTETDSAIAITRVFLTDKQPSAPPIVCLQPVSQFDRDSRRDNETPAASPLTSDLVTRFFAREAERGQQQIQDLLDDVDTVSATVASSVESLGMARLWAIFFATLGLSSACLYLDMRTRQQRKDFSERPEWPHNEPLPWEKL